MLQPDLYYSSVSAIDLADLRGRGITCLLIDLDNTLLARDRPAVGEVEMAFAEHVRDAGMRGCLVSNNWHDRVHAAASALGFELVPRALKPLPFGFTQGMRLADAQRSQTAVIGDQLFTDILGGNALGLLTILVQPLSATDLPHTLLLRKLEALVLAKRAPVA